jgi:CDP-diglyceride synthetase
MKPNKAWYKSKTIWGAIVAILALVAGAFGYSVGQEAQSEVVAAIIGVVGGLFAIYGRIKAVDKVQ